MYDIYVDIKLYVYVTAEGLKGGRQSGAYTRFVDIAGQGIHICICLVRLLDMCALCNALHNCI